MSSIIDTTNISPIIVIHVVDVVGVKPKGQISGLPPVCKTTSASWPSSLVILPVIAITGISLIKASARCINSTTSFVLPEFDIAIITSPSCIIPKSPCCDSAGCKNTDGVPVELTRTEFSLLKVFTENSSRVMTRLKLIDSALGYSYEGFERTVDAHVKNLRQKVELDPSKPQQIVIVYGGATNSWGRPMGLSFYKKILLAFVLVVLASTALTAILANRSATAGLSVFVNRGTELRAQRLAPALGDYYSGSGSWDGIGAVLERNLAVIEGSNRRGKS